MNMYGYVNPFCKKCNTKLILTKISNKWLCKTCNTIFEDDQVNFVRGGMNKPSVVEVTKHEVLNKDNLLHA